MVRQRGENSGEQLEHLVKVQIMQGSPKLIINFVMLELG